MVSCKTDREDHTHVFTANIVLKTFLHFQINWLSMKTNSNDLPLSCFTTCKVMTVRLFKKNCTINIIWWKIKSVSASKSITTGAITFKNSFCFLPFSLASFPRAFELVDLKKGFFPHLFNTPENQSYVGPIPPSKLTILTV